MKTCKLLPEICKIQYGYPFDSSLFSESGNFPLIRIRDVRRGYTETYTSECCSQEYIVNYGDILIGMDGEFNIAKWSSTQAYLNQRVCKLIPHSCIDNGYLFFFMPKALKEIEARTPFATVKHLSAKELNRITVPFPKLEEQQRISFVLQSVVNIIELQKTQLQKIDQLAKSRFIEMFGPYSQETTSAGSIMPYMRNGVSPSTHGKFHEKVLTLSAITPGNFDEKAWKDGCFVDCPPAEKRITASDFYMCRGNGNKTLVGVGVYSNEDHPDLVFPDTVIAARIDKQKICLPYLAFAWKMPSVRSQIECSARTTNGTYKINQQSISNIRLILPPISLQNEFASFIEELDKSKFSISRQQKMIDSCQRGIILHLTGRL